MSKEHSVHPSTPPSQTKWVSPGSGEHYEMFFSFVPSSKYPPTGTKSIHVLDTKLEIDKSQFEPHQCMLAGMWKRLDRLQCLPPRGQQVVIPELILSQCVTSAKCEQGCSLIPRCLEAITRSPKQGYQWYKEDLCSPIILVENSDQPPCWPSRVRSRSESQRLYIMYTFEKAAHSGFET